MKPALTCKSVQFRIAYGCTLFALQPQHVNLAKGFEHLGQSIFVSMVLDDKMITGFSLQ